MATPIHLFDSEGAEVDTSTRLQSLVENRSAGAHATASVYRASPDGTHVTTLDPSAGYVTIINTYMVAPDRAEALLELLGRATRETLRYVPGFVSANFHLSADRTQVVNYAQWRSREALAAAGADPNVVARVTEVAQFADSFTPIVYDFRQAVAAPDA